MIRPKAAILGVEVGRNSNLVDFLKKLLKNQQRFCMLLTSVY